MRLCITKISAALVTIIAVSASTGLAAPMFTILTPDSPNVSMNISGVSGDGLYAIGWQSNAAGSNMRATRWTVDNSTRADLGLLPGRPYSQGTYLSYNGSVATVDALDSSFDPQIFQWTSPSTKVPLPFMGTGTYVYSAGISSDGTVIGGWGGGQMCRWTSATGITIVPLPAGVTGNATPYYQYTRALSGDGNFIIANVGNAWPTSVGFRYDATTGVSTDIGQMQAGKPPELLSISNDGSTIMGISSYQFGPEQGNIAPMVGFVWTSGGGFTNIGSLSTGLGCLPQYLSGDGQTILGTSGNYMFIWTAASGIANFDSVLAANGVNLGMTNLSFEGISDDGRTIVGMGETAGGDYRGWVVSGLTVPEPGTLSLVVIGGIGLLRRRTRMMRS